MQAFDMTFERNGDMLPSRAQEKAPAAGAGLGMYRLRMWWRGSCEGPSHWRYLIRGLDEHSHNDDSTKCGQDLE
jgi:hypothetical protein